MSTRLFLQILLLKIGLEIQAENLPNDVLEEIRASLLRKRYPASHLTSVQFQALKMVIVISGTCYLKMVVVKGM